MAEDHERFMELAIEEAHRAVKEGNEPFGCVIVRQDEIVVRSHNQVNSAMDVTGHSERVTLEKAAQTLGTLDLSDCTLYTNWEPCPMCCGAILNAKVHRVVMGGRAGPGEYGDYTIEGLLALAKSHLSLVTDVLKQRCMEQVRQWEMEQAQK